MCTVRSPQASDLRIGQAKTRMVADCRAAIKVVNELSTRLPFYRKVPLRTPYASLSQGALLVCWLSYVNVSRSNRLCDLINFVYISTSCEKKECVKSITLVHEFLASRPCTPPPFCPRLGQQRGCPGAGNLRRSGSPRGGCFPDCG